MARSGAQPDSPVKLFLLVALLLVPTGAWGHGGVAMDLDPCIERAGVYLVHFSAYQPQEYATEEFCRSVPQTGSAILVFDLIDPELRKKSTAVRIIEETNTAEPRLLLDIPARIYPSGVVNAEVNFDTPGQYTALMTVDGVDGAARFPIRVASLSNTMLVLIAGLLIGCGLGYYVVGGKRGWPPFSVQKASPLLKG